MSKIICDVCGTSYPETATQCPICGCVRSGDSVTVAGDTKEATIQPATNHTHVKGGRFSKTNVKKRNSGKPIYSVESTKPQHRPVHKQEGPKKKKKNEVGLVVTVVALLIAIVTIVIYITCSALGVLPSKNKGDGASTTGTTAQTDGMAETGIACEEVLIAEADREITFTAAGKEKQISVMVSPENTTDSVSFVSEDDMIATVDADGVITAVGGGETIISVVCGDESADIIVRCEFENADDPDGNTDPTEPDPTVPETTVPENTTPDSSYTKDDLKFADNGFGYEYTIRLSEGSYNPYKGNIPAELVTFTSNDTSVVTVSTDGMVTFVGKGRAVVTAKYGDFEITCIFQII